MPFIGKSVGIGISAMKFGASKMSKLASSVVSRTGTYFATDRPNKIIGGAIGGLTGGLVAGPIIGGIPGAGAGFLIGQKRMLGATKAIAGSLLRHPVRTTVGAIGITSAYSFGRPIIGGMLIDQKVNRPTNPAIASSKTGPGFVSFGNAARVRMPHNNLGATGDLTLSMHKLRHGRR